MKNLAVFEGMTDKELMIGQLEAVSGCGIDLFGTRREYVVGRLNDSNDSAAKGSKGGDCLIIAGCDLIHLAY